MLENPPLTPPKRGITNKKKIILLLGGVRGGSYFNTANKSQLKLYNICESGVKKRVKREQMDV
jgi:hypothetical protein